MLDIPPAKAGVSIKCKGCANMITYPALKVSPGLKCKRCGATLTLSTGDYAAKMVMLAFAANLPNVSVE